MRALVFGVTPEEITDPLPADANTLEQHLRTTPMGVEQVDDPTPIGPTG